MNGTHTLVAESNDTDSAWIEHKMISSSHKNKVNKWMHFKPHEILNFKKHFTHFIFKTVDFL
jgi:hypothetical protein